MFEALANFVARHWLLTILAWVALVVGVNAVAPKWDDVTHDGDLAYLPDRMTTVRGEALLREAFPDNETRSQIVIVLERTEGTLTSNDLAIADALGERFRQEIGQEIDGEKSPIVEVWTRSSEVVGEKLVSKDRQATLVVLALRNEFMATANMDVLERVTKALDETRKSPEFPSELDLGVTGSAAVGADMLMAAAESIENTELVTVVMVLLILLLVYRAPLLVLVPLIAIVASVAVATDLVAMLTQVNKLPGWDWFDFKIFKTTRIFVITILFGSGTDFCLFLISRYREELTAGFDRATAIARALSQVSSALLASALTTVFGLSMMFFADFGKFRNSGPAIGLCLMVALVACLTLAPALLRAFGRGVFWPFRMPGLANAAPSGSEEAVSTGFWSVLSRGIMRRPGLILVASVIVMAPLAMHGLNATITYNLLNELDPHRPAPMGTAMLRRHFTAGETGPLTILARADNRDFSTREDRKLIKDLTKTLYEIDDAVVTVRSLEQPIGDKPRRSGLVGGFRKQTEREHPRTKRTYVAQTGDLAGKVTRFDVILSVDPFSTEAAQSLTRIESELQKLANDPESDWHGAEFDFLGTTAGTRDLKAVTESDQVLIQQLVVLAVLGVIVLILRRPVVCLFLIVSVLFSYFVTLGVTYWLFDLIYPTFDGLDWKVPIFLFVILIAVGEDYNIYLVTRVIEEQERWGMFDGVRVAAEKTGGIITSCGVIMAASFVSMTFSSLRGMIELGFALTLGIILDTFYVRPILVPSFLAILYRRHKNDAPPAGASPSTEAVEAERPQPARPQAGEPRRKELHAVEGGRKNDHS